MNTQFIDEAVTRFRLNAGRYIKCERYYNGSHDLAFATEKFRNTFGSLFREFALNLCPAICDAVRDKLRITGFSVDSADEPITSVTAETRRIWQANRMHTRSSEIHKEALKNGEAYAIVWPDESGRAAIYPNRASSCSVVYDDERPGCILRAAKLWRLADRRMRLNLFFPDRIERYVSRGAVEGTVPDASDLVPVSDGPEGQTLPNPFGVVPVFHFVNNADLGSAGRSELEAAIPIQDGLNKSVLDMLVAMEFSAFRQRWAAGIEYELDSEGNPISPFSAGADQLWISTNGQTRFGDFDATELGQFIAVKDSFRIDMAIVTGTPIHFLTVENQGFQSGESVRRSETRFLAKVRNRQETFGQVWSDLIQFARVVEGRDEDVRLITEWEDPAPLSERERLDNLVIKHQLGLSSEQVLTEAGYGASDANSADDQAAVRNP